jgi:large subunit ribosomal protein L24
MTTNKLKLKKGDDVIVISGREKGKKGKIVRVIPEDRRIVIGGVNKMKRHTKPSQAGAGGIVEKEMPMHISNVMLVDPKSGKGSRVGYKTLADGKKVRVARKSGEVING